MKKIVTILALAAILCGCTKEILNDQSTGDLIPAKLVFSGDVSIDEEPLTKAGTSNALLGVQVYRGTTPYAWGLFDTLEDICLYLHSGAKYSVICQYIKNGKKTLYHFEKDKDATKRTYILTDKDYLYSDYPWTKFSDGPKLAYKGEFYHNFHFCSNGFSMPFDIIDNYCATDSKDEQWCLSFREKSTTGLYLKTSDPLKKGSTHTVCAITNRFIYDRVRTINVTESNVIRKYSNVYIDRYYGESNSFTASPGLGTIVLNMKHLIYGLQCNVTGVSDGTASISIKNGDNTLLEKADISGEYHSEKMMFAFSDMHSAWQYSDDYSENVTVSLTWHRGVGVTQDLGSAVVQVKRNCMNVINVSLSTTTKACATLGVESEQSDMNIISIDSNTHF